MKRTAIFSLLIVFSFLLTGFMPAQAVSWSSPTVVALTGDDSFIATTTDPSMLAGVYKGEKGFYLPTGFPEDDYQFGGNALVLSGVTFGTEKLCFSFPTYNYGWRGSIYQWTGTKWGKLVTIITEGQEGGAAQACATIYGNGTYALLVGFDQKLAPVVKVPVEDCVEDLKISAWEGDILGIHRFYFMFVGTYQPEIDTPFTWVISNVKPAGYITPLSGSGKTIIDEDVPSIVLDGMDTPDANRDPFSFTLKVYTPKCHKIDVSIMPPPL